MGVCEDFCKKYNDWMYMVFRLLVGLMFFMHGAGKLFGWFGGPNIGFAMSLMGLAGVIEFLAGLAILLGFWTRLAALGGAVVMLGAFVMRHLSLNPLASGGELALMYLGSFLVLMIYGARKWSLEKKLTSKERF